MRQMREVSFKYRDKTKPGPTLFLFAAYLPDDENSRALGLPLVDVEWSEVDGRWIGVDDVSGSSGASG